MNEYDFDKYADNYDNILRNKLSFFERDHTWFAEEKVIIVHNNIKSDPEKILEFGCGIGRNIKYLRKHFPSAAIAGCDVSEKSLEVAYKKNPEVEFFSLNKGCVLDKYDLVLIANVLHHVTPLARIKLLKRIYNLLKDDGRIFVFEHNPYNPVTRLIVNTCELDKDAILVGPKEIENLLKESNFEIRKFNYILFFPPFLKWLKTMEKYLVNFPLGGQYFVKARKCKCR